MKLTFSLLPDISSFNFLFNNFSLANGDLLYAQRINFFLIMVDSSCEYDSHVNIQFIFNIFLSFYCQLIMLNSKMHDDESLQVKNRENEEHNQVNALPQPNHVPIDHPGSSERTSQKQLTQYLSIMGMSDVQQLEKHRSKTLLTLEEKGLHFDQNSEQSLKLNILESSKNHEYVLISVSYKGFLFQVSFLNINKVSPIHCVEKFHRGSFSSVYHFIDHAKNIAVKCNQYTNNTFLKVFRDTLLEYLSFEVIARLKSGPKMPKVFDFDLLVYKNCIEFSMEFCRHKLKKGPELRRDLREALKNLHCLRIIHFDIKPQNICYSEQHKRHVFIDLGLHRVIQEKVGFKTQTSFQGSLLYCSQEMRQSFLTGQAMVDLYYNDALCLQESIKEIEGKQVSKMFQMAAKELKQSLTLLIVKVKYILTHFHKYLNDPSFVKSKLEPVIKGPLFKQIQLFILHLPYTQGLEKILKELENQCNQTKVSSIVQTKFRNQMADFTNKEQDEGLFSTKMEFVKKLNQSLHFESPRQASSLNDCIKTLSDPEGLKKWGKRQYYQLFAELIQINSWKVSIEDKDKLFHTFNKTQMLLQGFDPLTLEQKSKKCNSYLSQFIANHTAIDSSLYQLIKYSLLSTIILEVCPQDELLSFLKKLLSMESTLQIKVGLFIHIMSSLFWISQICYTTYCQYTFRDEMYRFMQCKLDAATPNLQQEQYLIELVNALIQPISDNYKEKKILKHIKKLKEKLDYKLLKLYNTANGYEQLLAQILVYFLHWYNNRQPSLINWGQREQVYDFIVLMIYEKENNFCIFNFYQFKIAEYYGSELKLSDANYIKIVELGKIYKCLQLFQCTQKCIPSLTTRQEYLGKELIHFNKIELKNYNRLDVIITRAYIYREYKQILGKKDKQFTYDLPSLLDNLNLNYIVQYLPQLKRISEIQVGHEHEIIIIFSHICNNLNYYYKLEQFGAQMSVYYKIIDELQLFLKGLSCCYCKFFCLKEKKRYIDQQINKFILCKSDQNLVIWLIKQPDFIPQSRLALLQKLIKGPSQLIYEKLCIENMIYNNVSINFYHLDEEICEFKIKCYARMLKVLWQQRYILQQDGIPLYFSFIIYLCRDFTSPNHHNNQNIDKFCRVIILLIEDIDKVAFFQWNSNFLHDHKDVLKKQTYCSLYFAMVLYATDQNIFVKPFYYSFIWSNFHKLTYESRVTIQYIIYRSFLQNEIYFKQKPPFRKLYHLMELEFKSFDQLRGFGNLLIKYVKNKLKKIRCKLGKNSTIYKLIKEKTMKYYNKE